MLVTLDRTTSDHCICVKKTKNQLGDLSAEVYVYDNEYNSEFEFHKYFSNKELCITTLNQPSVHLFPLLGLSL